MTVDHTYFEILCTLAASSQLTLDEAAELREHFEECVSCRGKIGELTQTGAQLLFTHATQMRRQRIPKGMTDRFIARAIREGVPLSRPSPPVHVERRNLVAVVILALAFIAFDSEHGRFLPSSGSKSSELLAVQAGSTETENRANSLTTTASADRVHVHVLKTLNRKPKEEPGHELFANATAPLNRHFNLEPNLARAFFRGYAVDGGVSLPNAIAPSIELPGATLLVFHPVIPLSGAPALKLLAACESCAFSPASFQTRRAFASPVPRDNLGPHDPDLERSQRRRQFPLDLSTFQPVTNSTR